MEFSGTHRDVSVRRSMCNEMSRGNFQRRGRRVVHRRFRTKVRRLQRLIPGGAQGLQPDQIFLLTAEYILHLRFKVNVLQALTKLYKP